MPILTSLKSKCLIINGILKVNWQYLLSFLDVSNNGALKINGSEIQ